MCIAQERARCGQWHSVPASSACLRYRAIAITVETRREGARACGSPCPVAPLQRLVGVARAHRVIAGCRARPRGALAVLQFVAGACGSDPLPRTIDASQACCHLSDEEFEALVDLPDVIREMRNLGGALTSEELKVAWKILDTEDGVALPPPQRRGTCIMTRRGVCCACALRSPRLHDPCDPAPLARHSAAAQAPIGRRSDRTPERGQLGRLSDKGAERFSSGFSGLRARWRMRWSDVAWRRACVASARRVMIVGPSSTRHPSASASVPCLWSQWSRRGRDEHSHRR